jgi:DMSO/TMAO reductase YedYZ molybdopterin-dependent catalytic subunit
MEKQEVSRRTLLKGGGAALAGMTVLRVAGPAQAFPGHPDEVLIPWDDPPAPVPEPAQGLIPRQLDWEQLDSWLTPNDEFFIVQHYGQPVLNAQDWRLDIGGVVAHQRTLTLAEL